MGVGLLTETLKWDEPAYLTEATRSEAPFGSAGFDPRVANARCSSKIAWLYGHEA
jgi:hypothetical protein